MILRKNSFLRKNIDCIILTVFIASLATLSCLFIYGSQLANPPIRADGFGYYAYLPTVFIDHDLSFRLAMENNPGNYQGEQFTNAYGIGPVKATGGRIFDKYAPGTAALEIPFFVAADIYTQATHGIRSGYSDAYNVAITISGIFYLCLGSLLLYITARRLFDRRIALLSTLAMVFATNVFHYGTFDNSFSQIYSFASVSLYVYLVIRLMQLRKKERRYPWLLACGLCLGLIACIRAPDAILGLLLVPALTKRGSVKKISADGLIILLAAAVALTPMLYYLHHATGSIFTNAYHVFPLWKDHYEGFTNLRHPQVINFLFSTKKGLFFWSPVMLLAFFSVGLLIKRMRGFGVAVAAVLLLNIYICSSWWAWQFGGTFGSRPFVDMAPILAVSLATGLYYVRKKISLGIVVPVFFLLACMNLCLMYGYWLGYVAFDNTTWKQFTEIPGELQRGFWRKGFRF